MNYEGYSNSSFKCDMWRNLYRRWELWMIRYFEEWIGKGWNTPKYEREGCGYGTLIFWEE
jgi:hypothetical protein